MAQNQAKKKLHGFSKNERLCNFSLKNILFNQGASFHAYPFRIYWKEIDSNLEKVFFSKSITSYEGVQVNEQTHRNLQNPSWPYKKIPANAIFSQQAQCLIGVSAKVHKSAVVRNHLKRLIREAYRQNKNPFYSFLKNRKGLCLLGIVYTARPALAYDDIEPKIVVSLQKIMQRISQQQNL